MPSGQECAQALGGALQIRHSVRLVYAFVVRLYAAVRNNHRSGFAVRELGCSIAELKEHLERQFADGMTWGNWGRDGWHIDHVRPLASFDLEDPEQVKAACHFTNLQPLWSKDNIRKGNMLVE